MERLRARYMSRSLKERLAQAAFAGRVLSVHAEACNLADGEGRVIALVTPPVGNGPFHVMLAARAGVFDALRPGMAAEADGRAVRVERALLVSLAGAENWEPQLAQVRVPLGLDGLEDALASLWELAQVAAPEGSLVSVVDPQSQQPVRSTLGRRVRPAVALLLAALRAGDRQGVAQGTGALAGLGPGLTPAGDDLLVGLMAGLHMWHRPLLGSGWSAEEACRAIAETAAPRTTTLSAAWLRAAAGGEFAEPWHQLAAALGGQSRHDLQIAVDRILREGATSGADALAGLLALYLATLP